MLSLTPRLYAVAMLARGAKKIIDVGCDHGYLSGYMVTEGGAEHAYACDINKGPLSKARETAKNLSCEDRITLTLCDGLQGFNAQDADTVAICGMGGELIADILSKAPWTRDGYHKLVLQPMSRSEKLRSFLKNNGYFIEDEILVREDHRLYCVICAKGGEGDCGESNQYFFSDKMKKESHFADYLSALSEKYKTIISGKLAAEQDCTAELNIMHLLEENNAHR